MFPPPPWCLLYSKGRGGKSATSCGIDPMQTLLGLTGLIGLSAIRLGHATHGQSHYSWCLTTETLSIKPQFRGNFLQEKLMSRTFRRDQNAHYLRSPRVANAKRELTIRDPELIALGVKSQSKYSFPDARDKTVACVKERVVVK